MLDLHVYLDVFMIQVPFGEVTVVKDWLKVVGPILKSFYDTGSIW